GTLKTMIEGLAAGGVVRRDGKLEMVPAAHKTRTIDFGQGPEICATIPWGDVSTAWHSTQIPNIEIYAAMAPGTRLFLRAKRYFGFAFAVPGVQRALKALVEKRVQGPTAERRASGRYLLWGEAIADNGKRVEMRMTTPE